MYYKNVRVKAPVGFGSAANPTHFKTNTHSVLTSICSLSFPLPSSLSVSSASDSSFQRQICSHFGVKLPFSHTPLAVTPHSRGVRCCFIFFSEVASFSSGRVGLRVPTSERGRRKKESRPNVCFLKTHRHSE